MNVPKLSVITVSFNSAATIERTILSILNQTYPNIEFIIIDGASTDGTVNIIERYNDRIAFWLSEPDSGIYEAMNKGVVNATGEYVLFLGSDDCFNSAAAISNAVSEIIIKCNPEIWCGRINFVDNQTSLFKETGRELSRYEILSGAMSPHPAMLVKSDLLREHPFETAYRIAADYEFLVWCIMNNRKLVFSQLCMVDFNVAGISSYSAKAFTETKKIIKIYSPQFCEQFTRNVRKEYVRAYAVPLLAKLKLLTAIRRARGWKKYDNRWWERDDNA